MESAAPSFRTFCERRGYVIDDGALVFVWHMFPGCLKQPGTHNFWRVWNPVFGYVLHLEYRWLGARFPRPVALALTFLTSGLIIHDLPVSLVLGRPVLVNTGAFAVFAVLALLSVRLERVGWWTEQRWRNVPVHIGALVFAYGLGVWMNHVLLGRWV